MNAVTSDLGSVPDHITLIGNEVGQRKRAEDSFKHRIGLAYSASCFDGNREILSVIETEAHHGVGQITSFRKRNDKKIYIAGRSQVKRPGFPARRVASIALITKLRKFVTEICQHLQILPSARGRSRRPSCQLNPEASGLLLHE